MLNTHQKLKTQCFRGLLEVFLNHHLMLFMLSFCEHCRCKSEGILQPCHAEPHENAAGEREREAESNSGNMSEFFFLLLFVCRRLQCWAQAISGLCWLTHAHTDAVSLIRQVDGRQPLKYAVISWCLSPHVSFTSYLAYLYLSHKDFRGALNAVLTYLCQVERIRHL